MPNSFSVPDRVIICPGCQVGHLNKSEQKKKLGHGVTKKLCCDTCPTAFLQVQNRFKLIQGVKTSVFWQRYREISLTLEQWESIGRGAPVHYDTKIGTYIPYAPDKFSEPKPGYESIPKATPQSSRSLIEQPLTSTIEELPMPPAEVPVHPRANNNRENTYTPPRGISFAKVVPSIQDTSDLSKSDSSENAEDISKNYYMSKAGKTFLKKPLQDILETYHLLKCFEEDIELDPEEYDQLVKQGLLKEKKD
jgi:hypothetical protein